MRTVGAIYIRRLGAYLCRSTHNAAPFTVFLIEVLLAAVLPFTRLLDSGCVQADPLYVYRESHGVIRFSNKPPARGQKAEVFSPRAGTFSITGNYRSGDFRSRAGRARLFEGPLSNAYHELILAASRTYRLEPDLIKAVIHVESGFNPKAVSPKGAQGLMQLMPLTAKEIGVRRPFDPHENILGGSRYLAGLMVRFRGNLRFALAAYNAGESSVEQYGGVPPYPETLEYVERVIRTKLRYKMAALNESSRAG